MADFRKGDCLCNVCQTRNQNVEKNSHNVFSHRHHVDTSVWK